MAMFRTSSLSLNSQTFVLHDRNRSSESQWQNRWKSNCFMTTDLSFRTKVSHVGHYLWICRRYVKLQSYCKLKIRSVSPNSFSELSHIKKSRNFNRNFSQTANWQMMSIWEKTGPYTLLYGTYYFCYPLFNTTTGNSLSDCSE